MIEALRLIGELAASVSILLLAVSVIFQVQTNRLLRKRIELLEMTVYRQAGR
jgi:hypothetical protein